MAGETLNQGIGIIGFGGIAKLHAQVMQELAPETGGFLVAIADPQTAHPDKGIQSFKDYKDLLKLKNISSVIVATPPNSHFPIAQDALNAGKNVFLEKPPTLTIPELRKLEKLAKKLGKVLFTGFHTRYRSEIYKAGEVLKGEDIIEISINYKEDVVRWHGPGAWVFDPVVAGGGILIDSGINAVSVLTSIIPDFKYTIISCDRQFTNDSKVETSVKVIFEVINKTGKKGWGVIQMDGHYKGNEMRQYNLKTQEHEYAIDLVRSRLVRDGERISGDGDESRTEVDLAVEYRALFRDFFEHLKKKKSLVSAKELQFVLDAYKISS